MQEIYLNKENDIKPEKVEDLLIEIISAKRLFDVGDDLYATKEPLMPDQQKSMIVYAKKLRDFKKRGFPSRESILESNAIPKEELDEIKSIKKLILSHNNSRAKSTDMNYKNSLSTEMDTLQKRLHEINLSHDSILRHCAESRADDSRNLYLISRCTVGGDMLEDLVWNSYEEYMECTDRDLLYESQVSYSLAKYGLPESVLRSMARNDRWKIMWRSSKESNSPMFDGSVSAWSENQKRLVYWSDFYDSIYKHPEFPGEDIVADDARLQDWLNEQSVKNEKQDKGRVPSNKNNYYKNGKGELKKMHTVSQSTRQVNSAYKIRSGPR